MEEEGGGRCEEGRQEGRRSKSLSCISVAFSCQLQINFEFD
jgi:hypothetical protein